MALGPRMIEKDMILKVKKLHDDAVIPKYMSKDAAAFDISALHDVSIYPYRAVRQIYKVPTGLAFEIPVGYEMNVRARSGLSLKHPNYIVITGGGTIDADYRGPINVFIINHTHEVWKIKKGDRIAQCLVQRAERCTLKEVKELSETERGAGGFGSTGI
jgi:dUTP pyrophosphatase